MIVGMLAPEFFYGIDAVKNVRSGAISRRLGERRNVTRMIGASERHHRVTVREWRQRALRFMRRPRGRSEKNRVGMKTPLRGLGDGDVAGVNRSECAAKERNRAAMRMPAMRMSRRMCGHM